MKRILSVLLLTYSVLASAQTTPVEYNGRLNVKGVHLCNQDSVPIQLRGMSTAGIQWHWSCVNKGSITTLSKDWGCDIIRVAMYVNEGDAYNHDTAQFISRVDSVVQICTDLGLLYDRLAHG